MKVLLVEDDRKTAESIIESLKLRGHEVDWAYSLREARSFIRVHQVRRYDKGVFDMNLPDGLGTDLIAAEPLGFPVAFYSGLPDDVERKLRSMGVDGYPVFSKSDPFALLDWIG